MPTQKKLLEKGAYTAKLYHGSVKLFFFRNGSVKLISHQHRLLFPFMYLLQNTASKTARKPRLAMPMHY